MRGPGQRSTALAAAGSADVQRMPVWRTSPGSGLTSAKLPAVLSWQAPAAFEWRGRRLYCWPLPLTGAVMVSPVLPTEVQVAMTEHLLLACVAGKQVRQAMVGGGGLAA